MTELVRTYKITDSGAWGWETEEASGGGGGSLPAWWTVDNTPGSESVEFAGNVVVTGESLTTPILLVTDAASISSGGSIQFGQIGNDHADAKALEVFGYTGSGKILTLYDGEFTEVGSIGPTGAVTISPSDPAASALIVQAPPDPLDLFGAILDVSSDDTAGMLYLDRAGLAIRMGPAADGGTFQVVNNAGGSSAFRIEEDGVTPRIGFFGGSAVAQQALDPATCTAEDVANALIASTLMAQA